MSWPRAFKEIQLPRARRRLVGTGAVLAHLMLGTTLWALSMIGIFLLGLLAVFSLPAALGVWMNASAKLGELVKEIPDVLADKLDMWLRPARQAYSQAETAWKSMVLPRNAEVDLSVTKVLVEARPWNVDIVEVPPYTSFKELTPQPTGGKSLLLFRANQLETPYAWELPQAIVMASVQKGDCQDVFFFQRNPEGRFEPVSYRHVKPVIDSLTPLKDLA